MPKPLTNRPAPHRHRLWAELSGDSVVSSLRFSALGWVPRKRERVRSPHPRHALCVLLRGRGTFWNAGEAAPRVVRAPGLFFTAPGMRLDYGPTAGSRWEECYWILDGARLDEWKAGGWWPAEARFVPLPEAEAAALWTRFEATTDALTRRDRRALDAAKLSLERWIAARAAPEAAASSPLTRVIEAWRREPQRRWVLREAAAAAGVSYTRFRAQFREEFGTSPHQYLLRLRIELAQRWLRATDEPVKSLAERCGFAGSESFIRAFRRVCRSTPARWRLQPFRSPGAPDVPGKRTLPRESERPADSGR